MTLAELTALYSKVLRARPELQGNRAVDIYIQDCIEEVRRQEAGRPKERAPIAPVDFSEI